MNRGPLWFILIASVLGGVIPLIFRFTSRVLSGVSAIPPGLWTAYDYLQLMLWPMPLLLAPSDEPGAPDLGAWGPFTVAALANVALYGSLGGLIWLGIFRSRWVLVPVAAIVGGVWYWVWRT